MLENANSQLCRNPLEADFIQILASYILKVPKMSPRKEGVPRGWGVGEREENLSGIIRAGV